MALHEQLPPRIDVSAAPSVRLLYGDISSHVIFSANSPRALLTGAVQVSECKGSQRMASGASEYFTGVNTQWIPRVRVQLATWVAHFPHRLSRCLARFTRNSSYPSTTVLYGMAANLFSAPSIAAMMRHLGKPIAQHKEKKKIGTRHVTKRVLRRWMDADDK